LEQFGTSEVGLGVRNFNIHHFIGQCPGDEHHSPITQSTECITPRDKSLNTHLM
jgi:hypothetical protein